MKTSDELAAAKKELESKQKELERLEKGQGAGNRTAPFNKR